MKKYLAYYENEWPVNIAELTAVENKPFVGYLKGEGVLYTVIPKPVVYDPYITFTAQEDDSSIGLAKLSTNQTLEYSTDKSTWNTFNKSTNISLNNGDKVYVRGILSADNTRSDYTQFEMSGKIVASGNCNAIWNYEDLDAPLKEYCGRQMFKDCTSLTSAPKLPATTLTGGCYSGMFQNCSSLTTAPELPATELADYCYYGMFNGCENLTTAPELPATELAPSCYYGMFGGCKKLTTAPELPAMTLAENCYNWMFINCISLKYIKCLATDLSAMGCTSAWLYDVSSTGTFIKHPDTTWSIGTSGIPEGWIVEEVEIPYVTFIAQEDGSSIGLEALSTNQQLEYSTDTTSWNTSVWNTFNTSTNISLNSGDKLFVRGILSGNNNGSNYTQFKMDGKIAASGNCNAIWNYQDLNAPLKPYCGASLFLDCTALTAAPELPATELAEECYEYMFSGCTALTSAPELPATELADYCYFCMFSSCTSLNYIKCLATDMSSDGCTYCWVQNVSDTGTFVKHPAATWSTGENGIPIGWITEDADMPYVTFIAQEDGSSIGLEALSTNQQLEYSTDTSVWNTFTKSTNITLNNGDKVYFRGILSNDNSSSYYTQFKMSGKIAASGNCNAFWNYNDLNAPLKEYCGFRMFLGCTSLTSAPNLPAAELVYSCYGSMFYNCTSLTITPELHATTLANYCYSQMFQGCTALTAAPELPATELAYGCYGNMFYGCTSLTQAPELPATKLADYCYSGMFQDCTALTAAPELPATTLANYCYKSMFQNCTSLTKAPELPAASLKNYCYQTMFGNCTSLNYIKCLATVKQNSSTNSWVLNVSSTGTFVKHPNASWTRGVRGIPTGWTVEDAVL